jgi:hypothetical protein
MPKIVKLYEFECLRCDKAWFSRTLRPRRCGKCKSPYWDRPRKEVRRKA